MMEKIFKIPTDRRFLRIPGALFFFLALAMTPSLLHGQEEVSEESPGNESPEDSVEEDKREQILLYGIDSEVQGVLSELQREENDTYNSMLLDVMADTRNPDIAKSIYILWSTTGWSEGSETALIEINKVVEDEDYDVSVVQSAIAFIAEGENPDSMNSLLSIADHRNNRLAASAIRAMGKLADGDGWNPDTSDENSHPGTVLLERLKKEDPVAEDDLVASLITTLGQMRFQEAASEMILIAEDEGAPAGHRRLACIAAGMIGREEDYPIIERIYFESVDATLRSYALAGIAEYTDADTTDILVQALKRDSFWRIRVTAAEKLGEGIVNAEISDLLIYKAANDPVNQVRVASMKALGNSSGQQSRKFLIDQYLEKKNSSEMRLAALEVLVSNRMNGTQDAVLEIMEELWEKDEGRFLEYTCRNLSRYEWDGLSQAYEKMLEHQNWLLQVYGIRGIRKNSLGGLDGRVNALDVDGTDGRVRREINVRN